MLNVHTLSKVGLLIPSPPLRKGSAEPLSNCLGILLGLFMALKPESEPIENDANGAHEVISIVTLEVYR